MMANTFPLSNSSKICSDTVSASVMLFLRTPTHPQPRPGGDVLAEGFLAGTFQFAD